PPAPAACLKAWSIPDRSAARARSTASDLTNVNRRHCFLVRLRGTSANRLSASSCFLACPPATSCTPPRSLPRVSAGTPSTIVDKRRCREHAHELLPARSSRDLPRLAASKILARKQAARMLPSDRKRRSQAPC